MEMTYMVTAIDEEIARLQLVRKLLLGEESPESAGSVVKAKKGSGRGKHILSAEARERIANAQRKRWAAAKKAAKKAAKQ